MVSKEAHSHIESAQDKLADLRLIFGKPWLLPERTSREIHELIDTAEDDLSLALERA